MNPLAVGQVAVNDVVHAIQLSLAPVFLLNGIGVLLAMLTSRLSRIVDRARQMESELPNAPHAEGRLLIGRLSVISRRARLMNRAITLSTVAALLIALVVALLFASAFTPLPLTLAISLLFILSMTSLVGALWCFLIEVRVATASLRIGPGRP
jgi:uncharacterized protein DUF2721